MEKIILSDGTQIDILGGASLGSMHCGNLDHMQ